MWIQIIKDQLKDCNIQDIKTGYYTLRRIETNLNTKPPTDSKLIQRVSEKDDNYVKLLIVFR